MKITIVYYSRSGHTAAMAQQIALGAGRVAGCEAKAFALDAIDKEFLSMI